MKINPNILLLIFFAFISTNSFGQGVAKVLRKYKNDQGVTALSFDHKINQLIKNNSIQFKSIIDECEVIIFNAPNDISKNDKDKIKKFIVNEGYEELMSVKDKRGAAKLYSKGSGEVLSNVFAMLSIENKNVYLSFNGKIFFDELSKMNLFFEGGNELSRILKTSN